MKRAKSKYFFYILKCKDKTLYCGMAKDLSKRERQHNLGVGSAYVRSRGGGKIIYSESYKTIGQALRREAQVKKWSRVEKIKLTRKAK